MFDERSSELNSKKNWNDFFDEDSRDAESLKSSVVNAKGKPDSSIE